MDWCNGKRGFCEHDTRCGECEHFNGAGVVNVSESLIAYIKRLETQAPKWISVEERLPDKMATVLFATRNNPAVYRGRYIATGDKQAHYFTTRIGRANSGGTYAATHWMPLPEPPKEEAR